jgi:hypothetical protein
LKFPPRVPVAKNKRKYKNEQYNPNNIYIIGYGYFLTIDPVIAGDRFKGYEMAESSAIVEFKMTPEEIAAEDAENSRWAAIREAYINSRRERLNVSKMGESGEQKKQAVTYESGESGDLIEFYCNNNC